MNDFSDLVNVFTDDELKEHDAEIRADERAKQQIECADCARQICVADEDRIRADERRKCGEELLKRINEKECGIEKKDLWLISQINNICFDIPRICDLEGGAE